MDLDADLIAYIEASAAAAELEKEREIERARKVAAVERGRRRVAVAGLVVAFVLLSVAAVLGLRAMQQERRAEANAREASQEAHRADVNASEAFQQEQRAEASANEAKQRLADLQRQGSIRLAGMAREETRAGNAVNGMLLALEALPTSFHPVPDRPVVGDAVGALIEAMLEQRERAVLRGHEDAITSLDFSQDSKRIATASRDGTVRVWDAATGDELARLAVSEERNMAILTPDGTRVLTLSAYDVPRMWDVATRTVLFTLGDEHNYKSRPLQAVFSPDGSRILTFGLNLEKSVHVWDAQTGKLLQILRGHSGYVRFATFSNSGERVLTGSDDKTARIWDAASGRALKVLRGHKAPISAGAFSFDGRRVITASGDGTARLWEASTGKASFVLSGHSYADQFEFFPVELNREGSRALTRDSNGAHLWNAFDGKKVQSFEQHCGWWRFIARGQAVAALCDSGVLTGLRIWIADNGQEVDDVRVDAGKEPNELVFSDDTHNLAFAGEASNAVVKRSYLFAVISGQHARVWDFINDELLNSRYFVPPGTSAKFSADGQNVLLKSSSKLEAWVPGQYALRTMINDPAILDEAMETLSSAIVSDVMRHVSVSYDGSMQLLDGRTGVQIASLHAGGEEHTERVATFSADGSRLVTAVRSPGTKSWEDPRLWDGASGAAIADLSGHEEPVVAAKFNASGTTVATSTKGGTVRLWNAADGRPLAELPGYSGGSRLLTLSADGRQTLEELFNHALRVRDATSGAEVTRLDGHEEEVEAASFSADGSRIVTASKGSVRTWDTESGEEQVVFRSYIEGRCSSVEFSPDHERLVTVHVGGNSALRLWPVPKSVEVLVAEARHRLPRQLSDEERRRYFLRSLRR